MKQQELVLQSNYDQLNLHGTYYQCDQPKAIMVIHHGMCERRIRYAHFCNYLQAHNINSIIFDMRGHGESIVTKKELGFFNDTNGQALLNDLDQIITYAKQLSPNLPLILFGHSMGSLIVRTYAKTHNSNIDALVVCGPPSQNKLVPIALSFAKSLQKIHGEYYRSTFMQNIVFGTYAKQFTATWTTNAWLCTDPEVVKAYDKDPLCGFIFTLNGFINLFTLLKRCYSSKEVNITNNQLPIFFIAGEKDPCIISTKDFNKAVNSFRKYGFSLIKSKLYPNCRHEILNETIKLEVYNDIIQFINDMIKGV